MQIAVVCITGFFKKIMWQDFCWSIDLTPDFCAEVVLRLWDLALKWQSTGQPLELSRWLLFYWCHTSLAHFCCFWKRKGQQWLFSFLSRSPLTVLLIILEVGIKEVIWKTYNKFVSTGMGAGEWVQASCSSSDKYYDFLIQWVKEKPVFHLQMFYNWFEVNWHAW